MSLKIYRNVDLGEFYVTDIIQVGWLVGNVSRTRLEWIFWHFVSFWHIFPP